MVEQARIVLRSIAGWLSWASIVVGVLSLVSLTTRVFTIGLHGIFAEFVSFYQGLLNPIYELVSALPIANEIPHIAIDILALYLVLFGIAWRAGPNRIAAGYNKNSAYFQQYVRLSKSDDPRLESRYDSWYRMNWHLEARKALFLLQIIMLEVFRNYFRFKSLELDTSKSTTKELEYGLMTTQVELGKLLQATMVQLLTVPAATVVFFVINQITS